MKSILRKVQFAIIVFLSFGTGAIFALGTQGFSMDDFLMKFITGGIAMIIVFGTISYYTYKFLKKSKHEDPSKVAFYVYLGLTITFSLITHFGFYENVMEKREELTYVDWLENELEWYFAEQLKKSPELEGDVSAYSLAGCVINDIRSDDKYLKKLVKNKTKLSTIVKSEKFQEGEFECLEIIMDLK